MGFSRGVRAAWGAAAPLCAMILVGFLVGCSATEPKTQAPDKPNLVLYVIDTLRKDRLGVYGYPKPTSPAIDAFAREALVFTNAYAAAPWTLPSVVSLLTSLRPAEHQVLEIGRTLSADQPTLPDELRKLGYRCAAFIANPLAARIDGFKRACDISRKVRRHPSTKEIAEWLDGIGDSPFFLYIHTMEPHRPYVAPEYLVQRFGGVDRKERQATHEVLSRYKKLRRHDWQNGKKPGTTENSAEQAEVLEQLARHQVLFSTLYDAGIAWADETLAETLRMLDERGLLETSHFVLLADHGEEFFDHGGILHGQSLYSELTAIPMIWRVPGGSIAGRIDAPVGLLDVLPTFLDLAGAREVAASARGHSLRPMLEGGLLQATDEPWVASMRINRMYYDGPHRSRRGDLNVAVVEGRWKAIWNVEPDTVELYDRTSDPGDSKDLAGARPELARRLRDVAAQSLVGGGDGHSMDADLDSESLEQLRELGYIN